MCSVRRSSKRLGGKRFAGHAGKLAPLAVGLALASSLLGHTAILGDGPSPELPEYEVKAAFIYNFAKFVDWPSEAFQGSGFRVGIVGKDPFGDTIDRLISGGTAQGKTLTVHRMKDSERRFQCHILFVGKMSSKDLKAVLREVSGRPILTVSDSAAFTRAGGMIRLKVAKNKVRFEINLDAARKAGLKISSDLLRLADLTDEVAG